MHLAASVQRVPPEPTVAATARRGRTHRATARARRQRDAVRARARGLRPRLGGTGPGAPRALVRPRAARRLRRGTRGRAGDLPRPRPPPHARARRAAGAGARRRRRRGGDRRVRPGRAARGRPRGAATGPRRRGRGRHPHQRHGAGDPRIPRTSRARRPRRPRRGRHHRGAVETRARPVPGGARARPASTVPTPRWSPRTRGTCSGAMAAGLVGAYVDRHGVSWPPFMPQPDVRGPDLGAVVQALLVGGGA